MYAHKFIILNKYNGTKFQNIENTSTKFHLSLEKNLS